MHTISVNLYTFEELAPEVQQKVVKRESSINVENRFWYEPIIEDYTEQLEKLGFEQVKILFVGFGSQGDGACFEARITMATYLKTHHLTGTYPLLEGYPECVDVSLKHEGRYYHERSTTLVPYFSSGDMNAQEEAQLTGEYEAWEKDIYQEAVSRGREIYKALEEEYFHQISAHAVKETLMANAYTYLADGRPFTIQSPAYGR